MAPPTDQAEEAKGEVGLDLNAVFDLAHLRGLDTGLTESERAIIAEQALVLIESFYVHLPLKAAMEAINPVQKLRLLYNGVNRLSEEEFHLELLSIFNSLRDLHTNYLLPDPWRQFTAFLPFSIKCYYEGDNPRFLVGNVHPSVDTPPFAPGVEITHWQGAPMRLAVEAYARATPGANPAARRARAVAGMTLRPLAYSLPPQEDWVTITFGNGVSPSEARFPWRVFRVPPAPDTVSPDNADLPQAFLLGIDDQLRTVRRAQKVLFAPEAMEVERRVAQRRVTGAPSAPAPAAEGATRFPNALEHRLVRTRHGTFGYLKIRTFEVADVDAFLSDVVGIVRSMPPEGLIIDVRGNPGGFIPAGERLLQLFTDRTIEPEPLEFRSTRATRLMADSFEWLAPWRYSLDLVVESGFPYSQGLALTPPEEANSIGRVYSGKVALIVDALCYSTTDFFIAGFRDHTIGPIVGVDGNTGAGGANVWTHGLLCQLGLPLVRRLPKGASMRCAVRRSTRRGTREGLPLEGLGVKPDVVHRLTYIDLVYQDADLFDQAGELLVQV